MSNALKNTYNLLPKTNDGLEIYTKQDWRRYFTSKLVGRGLEIGPLHRPMCKHEGMRMDYIDRYSIDDLRKHYPELRELPLVEANIIGDAQDLAVVKDSSYDFLISAHVIEHMKDPIRALENWARVVKPGGLIYLIAPDKRAIFDFKRQRTDLAHIIEDYKNPSDKRDFEHYVDYAMHVHYMDQEESRIEAKRLIETDYSIHYHVFIPKDMTVLLNWFSENVRPIEILEGPMMSPQIDEAYEPINLEKQGKHLLNDSNIEICPEADEFHFLLRVK